MTDLSGSVGSGSQELKACPFCGGSVDVVSGSMELLAEHRSAGTCPADGLHSIEAWNRRASAGLDLREAAQHLADDVRHILSRVYVFGLPHSTDEREVFAADFNKLDLTERALRTALSGERKNNELVDAATVDVPSGNLRDSQLRVADRKLANPVAALSGEQQAPRCDFECRQCEGSKRLKESERQVWASLAQRPAVSGEQAPPKEVIPQGGAIEATVLVNSVLAAYFGDQWEQTVNTDRFQLAVRVVCSALGQPEPIPPRALWDTSRLEQIAKAGAALGRPGAPHELNGAKEMLRAVIHEAQQRAHWNDDDLDGWFRAVMYYVTLGAPHEPSEAALAAAEGAIRKAVAFMGPEPTSITGLQEYQAQAYDLAKTVLRAGYAVDGVGLPQAPKEPK